MNKIFFLFLILFAFSCQFTFAQNDHNEVLNLLKNKHYGDSTGVTVYLQDSYVEINYELSNDLTLSFIHAIESIDQFLHVRPIILTEEGKAIDTRDGLGSQYVFICILNDVRDMYPEQKGTYYIDATLKCIDIVSGEIMLIESFKSVYPKLLNAQPNQRLRSIHKRLKKFNIRVKDIIRSKFRNADWIRGYGKMQDGKKDCVYLNLELFNKNRKPKKISAFVVSQKINVRGKTLLTFEKVGSLKKPFLHRSNRELIGYQIDKGKEEIFEKLEKGIKIYVSTLQLGGYYE